MAELELWMTYLRKTINPHEDSSRRVDVSLKLWVQEAKNCQSKKRYFCEILLDKTVYARTSTKAKGDMLFWGEQFEFENLPAISSVTLTLFKESNDKRTRLRQVWTGGSSDRGAVAVGCVTIAVSELLNRQLSEQWYPVSQVPAPSSASTGSRSSRDSKANSAGAASASGESLLPQIRVKARYQAVQVLPLALYSDLSQYVQHNYLNLVAELEPALPVRAKDDVATVLVNILHHEGKATMFLCDIVMADVLKQENSHVVFRGNTIATKAIEAYMKLVSVRYLRSTLGECVRAILDAGDDCEVDPSKLHGSGGSGSSASHSALARHQASLVKYCEQVWTKIAGSLAQFPSELRDVFAAFRGRCRDLGKADLADNLISACVFLRLLCPAIMSPSLFGLCHEFPDERASRTLTLVAKTIQSLANFTKFGSKEDYMLHMNEFVDREWARMHEYLQKISSIDSKYRRIDYEGRVDVAKHLSLLHSLLVEEAKAGDSPPSEAAASGGDSSDKSAGSSPVSEMRRHLQPVLQRLTDEVLHGGEVFPSSPPAVSGSGGSSSAGAAAAAIAVDCTPRQGHSPDQAVPAAHVDWRQSSGRRSRPLSAGDHSTVAALKDGCAPLPTAGEVCSLAAATKPRDGTPSEPAQWPGAQRHAAAPLQHAAGERHALTEPRARSFRQLQTSRAAGGGGGGSGGLGSGNPVECMKQPPSAAAVRSVGGGRHELASDSAYDTLRSTGSHSDGGWSQCDASFGGGGGGSGSRLNDSLCGSSGSLLASTKKMVLHKVWDRVLTANELITGDYVDLISYVDDTRGSPSDGSSGSSTLTTTPSAAAAPPGGGGHHAASASFREGSDSGSSASLGSGGGDTLSKKAGAGWCPPAPTTPVRQAPLTIFNPAFRVGTSHVPAGPEPSTALPFSRSYPGHVGTEPADASGSGTTAPPRPPRWHTPDRYESLSIRAKHDTASASVAGHASTTMAAAAGAQVLKLQLPLLVSLGTTPVAAAAAASSVAPLCQVPILMTRWTVSNGSSCSPGSSGGGSFGRPDAASAPREQPSGADMYAAFSRRPTAASAAATPMDGSGSRRDMLPGESSTWSRGMSSGQCAYRDERLSSNAAASSSSSSYHQSHLDVHGRASTASAVLASSMDGCRTLPIPRRSGVDMAAERESVEFLKQQVEEAQRRLVDTEQRLAQQAEQTDRTIQEWRQRLEASEEVVRLQSRVKDEQIEGIVQRLMAIEEELRREQRDMKDALSQRQRLVELQEKKIRLLDETNSDLLRALREHVACQAPSPSPAQLLQVPSAERQPSPRPDSSTDDERSGPPPTMAAAASAAAAAATAASTPGGTYKTTLYYSQTGSGGTGL